MLRTHTCGELNESQAGQTVTLCGWVHRRRDHGGIIFIDLRDRYGLTQLTFDPEASQATWQEADKLRSEWVIKVRGKVADRPKDMINPKLATGEIEVEGLELEVLSKAKALPFEIDEEKAGETNESLRLKYRFLDIRREKIQKLLQAKDEYIQHIRKYFHERDFIEVQTPILANSSPEGARDFLVPSRLHPGKFYALPQAPQQFKQLLMVGGFDRYFQIAPCFRDEDPRMDRHYGEFYQLDMEMSFVSQEDILDMTEPLMVELTKKFSNKKIVALDRGRFQRIPWKESMEKYGTDKPDLRYALEITQITDMVRGCGFSVFTDAVKNGGVVHALKVDGGAKFTRREIDEITEVAKSKEAKGLAYIVVKSKVKSQKHALSGAEGLKEEDNYELQSPIVKFLGDELAQCIVREVKAEAGDIIFFGADKWRTVCNALGAVRSDCASRLGLKDNSQAAWCWIVDFPMYDYSDIEPGRVDFGHNPFSMPQGGLKALEEKDPFEILAYQFDLVINGFEASSGAIRNHDPKIMYKAFAIAGYSKEEVDKKFGAMIRAFEYGAPPHGGNAPGIDRIMMVLNDLDSIRDIYAFPKDGRGKDLMTGSPSEVDEKQLKELHIKLADVHAKAGGSTEVYERVKQYLDEHKIKYETRHHQPVFTSKQAAKVRGTELKQGARALIFKADNKFMQIVTAADKKVDVEKFKNHFQVKELKLATAAEIKQLTNCEIGAVPPFGNLFNLPVYIDKSLADNDSIAFNAGTNTDSIIMKYGDYARIAKAEMGEFSVEE